MSLVLCDGHRMFVDALAMALRARDHDVAAICSDLQALPGVLRQARPDLCVLGLQFGGRARLEAVETVRASVPGISVLVLTGWATENVWRLYDSRTIDGLVSKGKCYSSMAQMLGTRSVIERLAQYILNLSELYGVADGDAVVINRKVTHDQIAAMVGSTRQWVTMMLKRFHAKRIVSIDGGVIRIHRLDQLEQILLKD